ncbi:C40 family peptidase [Xylanibacter brevis]|uniref:C40 family peptidase n=1 Tax=Xylanibacter brevis TaxID=83231 RepID=UPI00138E47B3|nr:NlpC/P60 family protein [Xylanibacter brevis]
MKLFEQKRIVGGGDGSINNPYTYEQFLGTLNFPGGWVDIGGELTYCYPEVVVVPNGSDCGSGTWDDEGYLSGGNNYGSPAQDYTLTDSTYISTGSVGSSTYSSSGSSLSGSIILENARKYEGTKYVYGGISATGIDCSGLIMRACNLNIRWTTSSRLPSEQFEIIKPSTSSHDSFVSSLHKGDILVWPGQHAVIYVDGYNIYHAHSSGVNQTGDLSSYWIKTKGYPVVYRVK